MSRTHRSYLPRPQLTQRITLTVLYGLFLVLTYWPKAHNLLLDIVGKVGNEELGKAFRVITDAFFSTPFVQVFGVVIVVFWGVYFYLRTTAGAEVREQDGTPDLEDTGEKPNPAPQPKRSFAEILPALVLAAVFGFLIAKLTTLKTVNTSGLPLGQKYNVPETMMVTTEEFSQLKQQARAAVFGKKPPPPKVPSISETLTNIGLIGDWSDWSSWENDVAKDVSDLYGGWNPSVSSWIVSIFLALVATCALAIAWYMHRKGWHKDEDLRGLRTVVFIIGLAIAFGAKKTFTEGCVRKYTWVWLSAVDVDRMEPSDVKKIVKASEALPRLEFAERVLVAEDDPQGKIYAYYVTCTQDQQWSRVLRRVCD